MQQGIPNTVYFREIIGSRLNLAAQRSAALDRKYTAIMQSIAALREVSADSVSAVEAESNNTQAEMQSLHAQIIALQALLDQTIVDPHAIAQVFLDVLSVELSPQDSHKFVLALIDVITKSETSESISEAPVTVNDHLSSVVIMETQVDSSQVSVPAEQSAVLTPIVTERRVASQKIRTPDSIQLKEATVDIDWLSLSRDTSTSKQALMQRFQRLYEIVGIKSKGRGWMLERLPALAQRVTTEHLQALAIRDPSGKIYIETALALLRVYDFTAASGYLQNELPNFASKAKPMIAATINCTKESLRKLRISPDTALAPQIFAAIIEQNEQQKAKKVAEIVVRRDAEPIEQQVVYPEVTKFRSLKVPGDVLAWIQKNGLEVEKYHNKSINSDIAAKIKFFVAYLRGEIESFETNLVKFYQSEEDGHKYLQIDHGRSNFRIMFRFQEAEGEFQLGVGAVVNKSDQAKYFKRSA